MLYEIHSRSDSIHREQSQISPCMNPVLQVGSVHGEFGGKLDEESSIEAIPSTVGANLQILPHHVRAARSPGGIRTSRSM